MATEGIMNPTLSRINVLAAYPSSALDLPILCKQCDGAPCIATCPRQALKRDHRTGAVTVDKWDCNGCAICMSACPLGAILIRPNGLAAKCDLCRGDPRCVGFCPVNAIAFKTLEEVSAERRLEAAKHVT